MERCPKTSHSSVVVAVTISLFLVTFSSSVRAEQKTIRLLTIGNSFAENALTYLPSLVESAGHKLVVGRANLGGCTLERHWKHAQQFEADPDGKEGSPYGGGKYSLKDLLTKDRWDFITIQQVSYTSHDLQTYQPFANNLHRYIREHAPDATILVHQIWAYRSDDPRFQTSNEGKEPHTHAVMYDQVRDAYRALAKKLNLNVLPSGDAMFRADTDPVWGYRVDDQFDFENASYPNLPDQKHSLHVGWSWKKRDDARRELGIDGHHASSAGKYLLGCVWFETLYNENVIGNHFVPVGLDPEYANFLQQTAHVTVSGGT
ncbi:DUF4886 domain-containing protein [Neorhodopirellula pilleata]|uniref:DUF4886 domain-containing protein n=1 Tax=Neorhodopirellula pilleata TaxID=2714738 RepID=A0A5C6A100_9BACT|nr:DUF4886 domain-containing protein [Neorhodopirellula pilleata]TWT92223.1 hypothetical protein Pla100_47600 [Neorhodopirellula pilleata]